MFVVNARFLTQDVTGVQRFALEICKKLISLNDHIIFVAPSNVKSRDLIDFFDVKIIGERTGHLWEQIDLPLYLRSIGNPILLNLANTGPIFYKRNVITVHDVAFKVYPEAYSFSFSIWYKLIIPILLKNALKILTVSEYSKSEITKFYKVNNERINVIHNAVTSNFKKDLNSNIGERYFLALSSLSKRKNLISLFKAFQIVAQQISGIRLYVIGDIATDSFSRIDISNYLADKNILFLGRLTDEEIISYYSNAEAFVYPSFYEGFGIPPLEAQACDCPTIVSDRTSLPEIFKTSTLYCDPYSIQSIVDSMLLICKSEKLRSNLIEYGKENVQLYSWDKSASKLLEIVAKLNN